MGKRLDPVMDQRRRITLDLRDPEWHPLFEFAAQVYPGFPPNQAVKEVLRVGLAHSGDFTTPVMLSARRQAYHETSSRLRWALAAMLRELAEAVEVEARSHVEAGMRAQSEVLP